jgi:hypothetical protein
MCITVSQCTFHKTKCRHTIRRTDSLLSRRESLRPFTDWLADQSPPRKANSTLATHLRNSYILHNPDVHRLYKNPPQDRILTHINPFYTLRVKYLQVNTFSLYQINSKCSYFTYLLYFTYMFQCHVHLHKGEPLCHLLKTRYCYKAVNIVSTAFTS